MDKISFQANVSYLDDAGQTTEVRGGQCVDIEEALKELYLMILSAKPSPENAGGVAASILVHISTEGDD